MPCTSRCGAYAAMPEPSWVMATGTCAVSGGMAGGGYACGNGLERRVAGRRLSAGLSAQPGGDHRGLADVPRAHAAAGARRALGRESRSSSPCAPWLARRRAGARRDAPASAVPRSSRLPAVLLARRDALAGRGHPPSAPASASDRRSDVRAAGRRAVALGLRTVPARARRLARDALAAQARVVLRRCRQPDRGDRRVRDAGCA